MLEAILGVLGTLTVGVLGYLGVRYQYRDKPTTQQGSDLGEELKSRWLARLDALEAEIATERTARMECLVECARLRAELDAARQAHSVDAETIRTLRRRIDDLMEVIDRER